MSKGPVLLVDNMPKRVCVACRKSSRPADLQVETLRNDEVKQLLLEGATAVTEQRRPNGDEVPTVHEHSATLVDFTMPN